VDRDPKVRPKRSILPSMATVPLPRGERQTGADIPEIGLGCQIGWKTLGEDKARRSLAQAL
jgi:hypothetical protein